LIVAKTADTKKAPATSSLSVNINSNGYTFLVVCIFLAQIVLIGLIKFMWLDRKVKNEDKKFWKRAE
jgi:hypothetical protein